MKSSDLNKVGIYELTIRVTYDGANYNNCDSIKFWVELYDYCLSPTITVTFQSSFPDYYYDDSLVERWFNPFIVSPSECTIVYNCIKDWLDTTTCYEN